MLSGCAIEWRFGCSAPSLSWHHFAPPVEPNGAVGMGIRFCFGLW